MIVPSQRPRRRVLGFAAGALAVAAAGGIWLFISRSEALESSPATPRPWAEEEFRKWTMPVPSPGLVTDPQYVAACRVTGKSITAAPFIDVEIRRAALEYVPKCRIIDSDAQELFPALPDPLDIVIPNDRKNALYKFRQLFDAATHVAMTSGYPHIVQQPEGLLYERALPVLHDVPLLAVFDVYHGAVRDFPCKPAAGESVIQPEFRLDVIGIMDCSLDTNAFNLSRLPKVRKLRYDIGHSPFKRPCSVLFQVNPHSMRDAITLEAFDSEGKEIEGAPKTEWDLSLYHFDAPLARVASLRVRYRPDFTRLLLHIKSQPPSGAAYQSPTNLFDLTVPEITFRDPDQMRDFIADTVEFKNLGGSHEPASAFPIALRNADARQVIERYLALDAGRRVIVDSVAMTVQFEDRRRKPWPNRVLDWLKHPTWRP